METVHLIGSEEVKRAAHEFLAAAESIRRSVGFLDDILSQRITQLQELAERMEKPREKPSLNLDSPDVFSQITRYYRDCGLLPVCPLCQRLVDVVDGTLTVADAENPVAGWVAQLWLECPDCTSLLSAVLHLPFPLHRDEIKR